MRVDLGRLAEEGEHFEGELGPEVMGFLAPEITPLSPIRYSLFAVVAFEDLLVDGSLKVRVRFVCSRCAEDFEADVEEPKFHYDCRIEDGSQFVDLTEEIRESILLTFPVHPVCRADCRGLCPKCGANRNLRPCRCKPPHDDCWGALNGLALH